MIVDLIDPNFAEYGHNPLWDDVLHAVKKWLDPYGSVVINAGGITSWNVENLNKLLDKVYEQFSEWKEIHLYKVFVPSFGREWCFILLNHTKDLDFYFLPSSLSYCNKRTWEAAYRYGWSQEYLENIGLNIEHQLPEEDDR